MFEETKTFERQLADIVEQAIEKYGYHKMHVSGMYEMIKNAPSSELYELLELRTSKDTSISFYFDGQLCIKLMVKKEALNVSKELYSVLLDGKPAEELKGSAAPKGGVNLPKGHTLQSSHIRQKSAGSITLPTVLY